MGGESLDARLEPIAEILILLLVLLAVASLAFFFINKAAARRREKAHRKLSTSRRSKDSWVDLSGERGGQQMDRRPARRRSRQGSSNDLIDILAKLDEPNSSKRQED